MANDNQIGLEALFENEKFQKGLASYNSDISSATAQTDQAGSTMSGIWEGLSAVGAVAFEAIGVAIGAVTAALYVAVDAAMDSEEVFARMNFIVGNTSERTGVAAEDVLALADSISQIVPIDDEVITSAITMGLTFDGVNKDNIQPLIMAAADLSSFTGKDLPASMRELSLAISDPDRAMRLLKDANITLTDAQMDTLKGFKDTGDTAGATAFILEQLKQKGIIGLGEAMGDTAKGKMKIMQTAIGNITELLGGGLLDSLSSVFDKLTEFATDPRTIAFFTDLGETIGQVASDIVDRLPDIMEAVTGFADWLANNKPLIIGILAAIGVAMAAFAVSVVVASAAAIEAALPIIAVMAAVGLAVGFLYKAWSENWGGIQDKVKDAWKKVKPLFDQLKVWLQVNVPKAIKILADYWEKVLQPAVESFIGWAADTLIPILVDIILWVGTNLPKALKTAADFWTNVLWPAIKAISNFLTGTVFPIFQTLFTWLSNTLSAAIKTLSSIWTTVLLPALQAVWNFINGYILPLMNSLSNLLNAVVGLAVRALAGIWQNVLLPALQTVWNFISSSLNPVFTAIGNVINNTVRPALEALGNWMKDKAISLFTPFTNWLNNTFIKAWNAVKDAVQFVIDGIDDLVDAINSVDLPDWMTGSSTGPSSVIGGLKNINNELGKMSGLSIPAINSAMNGNLQDVGGSLGSSSAAGIINNSNKSSRTYIFGAQFNFPGPSGFIESLQGS